MHDVSHLLTSHWSFPFGSQTFPHLHDFRDIICRALIHIAPAKREQTNVFVK